MSLSQEDTVTCTCYVMLQFITICTGYCYMYMLCNASVYYLSQYAQDTVTCTCYVMLQFIIYHNMHTY